MKIKFYFLSILLSLLGLTGCQSLTSDSSAIVTKYKKSNTLKVPLNNREQTTPKTISDKTADDISLAETLPPNIEHKYQYKVRGKQYKVFKSGKNFQQIGSASWYGPGFHGKKTANGERYNMHAMTAAHKTLPLGTKVQVTNLSNGRKIIVRINDRGPFHGGRIIDLSKKAAQKLGIIKSGYGKVHLKIAD